MALGFAIELEAGSVGFCGVGKTGEPGRGGGGDPQGMDKNQQQIRPTNNTGSQNWTQATLVESESSHHYPAIPACILNIKIENTGNIHKTTYSRGQNFNINYL